MSRRTSRGHSARHLLNRNQLRQSLIVAAPPSVAIAALAGLQAALAIFLALLTAHLSPWPELVGFPALGALAALFGRYASLRHRRRIVIISGTEARGGYHYEHRRTRTIDLDTQDYTANSSPSPWRPKDDS